MSQIKPIKVTTESESSKSEFERLIKDYEKTINLKDEEIASQKEIIKSCGKSCNLFNRVSSKDEVFHIKPKGNGSTKNIHIKFPECESTNVG